LRYAEEIRGVLPRNRVVRPTGVTCALPPSLIVGGVCAAHVPDLKFSNTTYSITAAYRVRPDLNLYATHRTGFRAGGWNVFSSITNGIFSFEPETVSDFEAGVKSELFDRRVRFNLAAYASKYKDIQKATNTFLPTGASVRQINNAASATIKGGEVQLTASPTRSVTLDVSGAYTDAHYDEFVVRNATGAVVEDRTDEPFEFPKWTFSVGANKKWDVPIGVISARADWYWTSKVIFTATSQLTSAEQVMKQDSYGLLAARVELQVPEHGLTVAILGRNLLDKDYLVGAIDVRSLGWSIGIPGEPRYVGVEIRKSFGGTE
jgi:iron complex outermembrane receptor protein